MIPNGGIGFEWLLRTNTGQALKSALSTISTPFLAIDLYRAPWYADVLEGESMLDNIVLDVIL